MNQTMRRFMNRVMNPLLLALAGAALLAGCASGSRAPSSNAQYDFGTASAAVSAANVAGAVPALVITDVTGSPAFDSDRMFYRLNYADPLQSRSYANSRWSASPLQMLTQRFRSRVAQAGVKVLTPSDGSTGVPLLRIDLDDFAHTFDSTANSYGQLVLRASLFHGHTLVDQRTFSRKIGSASADAAGGARALAEATDAVAAEMIAWLASVRLPKE